MRRSALFGAALDVALVLLFAAIGRRSHAESSAVFGVLNTAWPFLVGAGIGWLTVLVTRRHAPLSLGGGVVVWAGTIVGGMTLRALTGSGVAVSFIVVASSVTAVFLLGWRAIGVALRRRGSRAHA